MGSWQLSYIFLTDIIHIVDWLFSTILFSPSHLISPITTHIHTIFYSISTLDHQEDHHPHLYGTTHIRPTQTSSYVDICSICQHWVVMIYGHELNLLCCQSAHKGQQRMDRFGVERADKSQLYHHCIWLTLLLQYLQLLPVHQSRCSQ